MICLNPETIIKLSSKGVLAYVAVMASGDAVMTTAQLSARVRASTGIMLEGLKELSVMAPEVVRTQAKGKWQCGSAGMEVVQLLESTLRFRDMIEDLKKYWDFLNPEIKFSFNGQDGVAVRKCLEDHANWKREQWQMALQHRARSVKFYGNASRTQNIAGWVRSLGDYLGGPLNQYGRPVEGMGNAGKAIAIEHANRAATAAYLGGGIA